MYQLNISVKKQWAPSVICSWVLHFQVHLTDLKTNIPEYLKRSPHYLRVEVAVVEEQDVQEERRGEEAEDALAQGSGEAPSAGHQSGIQLKDMTENNAKINLLDSLIPAKLF